jgi:Ca2+-binding EF-hand superfamily protein
MKTIGADFNEKEINELIYLADENNDDKIQFDEFLKAGL